MSLKILILEDSEVDAEILHRLLNREMPGSILAFATNKEEFVHELFNFNPDVILADNSLPQFSATEALSILREDGRKVPFILVTGTVSEEFAAGIIKLGASDYILKDRLARLPSAIEAALNQARTENEKLRAYSKLIESEERYRTLIERITDAFIALDQNWRYTYVNKQAARLLRKDVKDLIGKHVWDVFPDAVNSETYKSFQRAMKDQEYITNIDYYEPLDLWQENHIYPSPNGLSVFIRDITMRKKTEDEVMQMNKDLHDLSSHLQKIREEERVSIAREIHDELGQQLTGLKMDMHWLQKKLIAQEDGIKEKIKNAVDLIGETIKTVRRIVANLRPLVLDDLGLASALDWQRREVEKRYDMKVNLTTNMQDTEVSSDIATNIFRIYQEILNNAVKHSGASEINSSLDYDGKVIELKVKDNGIGFTAATEPGKSFGLLGIKERTYILGGTFDLKTAPRQGTEIQVTIPYSLKN